MKQNKIFLAFYSVWKDKFKVSEFKMQSRQFPTFNEAIAYLETQGKLTFHGRIGIKFEICLYSYMVNGTMFTLNIYNDGLVEIRE